MATSNKLQQAFERFDAANQEDPNTEVFQGKTFSKEPLYAIRMTELLFSFAPNASEALQLTARCQHICRWEIARDSHDMNREGYLRWRQELKKFHAEKAASILSEVGYSEDIIKTVKFLLEKKQLKKNEETQTLEDVICLVFLAYYFEPFAANIQKKKPSIFFEKRGEKCRAKVITQL